MIKPDTVDLEDIVTRLRTDRNGRVYCDELVNAAADEIERLRASQLRGYRECSEEIKKLQDEIEQLRRVIDKTEPDPPPPPA